MNWLRLQHLQAEEPQLITGDDGFLEEVQVTCRTRGAPVLPTRPCCAAPVLLRNGTKTIKVRDRRIEPAPTWLLIQRQRFKCKTCGATSYELLPDVDDDHYITGRFKDDLIKSAITRPFEDAARIHAVEPTIIRRLFLAYAHERLKDYTYFTPRVFGVDENRIVGGDRFICADIESGLILDMLPTRDAASLTKYFEQIETFPTEVFCQDMWRGYANIAERFFPKALVVIDRFHVVRYANEAMDKARKALQARMTNVERRAMKRINRTFLARWESLDERRQDQMAKVLAEHPMLSSAYAWKERFFDLYELESRSIAERAFIKWATDIPNEIRPFFRPVIRMVKNWAPQIFNYYEAPYTNGLVENLNGRINQINRRGYGYDFETLRAKALLRYGKLIPLGSLVHFSFVDTKTRTWTPELVRREVERPVGHGIDPSTLDRALARGRL